MIAALLCLALSVQPVMAQQEERTDVPLSTTASVRLAKRLVQRYHLDPAVIPSIVYKRQLLLQKNLIVTFENADGSFASLEPLQLSLSAHPDMVTFDPIKSAFVPDERSIRYFLDASDVIPHPQHALGIQSDSGAVQIYGTSQAGYRVNAVSAASLIVAALEKSDRSVTVALQYEEPTLVLVSDGAVSELTLLSRGMSDFAKSPFGRESNIRRALATYLNGIVIPQHAEFSFNDAFVDSSGWSPALIIGEGGKLVYEPGGGICQAASTVFRAALLAGLPIVKHANHSLYVGYYEEYGVGLDATVYPGKQDLKFKNDTSAPIVMAARSDGTRAIVELYGKRDGRTVSLSGPFFSTSNDGFSEKLTIKQIGWNYNVTYADGQTIDQPIVSTYTMLPKLIRTKYAEAQGKRLLSELVSNPTQEQVTMR